MCIRIENRIEKFEKGYDIKWWKNQLVLNITCDGSPYLRKITDYQTQIVRYFIGCDKYHQNEKWHCYAKLKQEELDVPLLKDLFEASAPVKEISHCNMIIPKVSKYAYHVNDGNVICGVIVEKPCPVCFIRIILECPFVAIKCIGVHNHPPPSPDKLPNGIKSNLQALIEQSIDDNDTTTLDSILSGNLIKAYFDKEFLPEVHSSLDNIDKLRYLVAKVASFWSGNNGLDTNRCQFKLVKGELNEFEINRYDPEHHLNYLVTKIESFLLQESLDSLCGASAVYLTIENDILLPLEIGYIGVQGLKALKGFNVESEIPLYHSQDKIEENINKLKILLEHPVTVVNTSLYGALKQTLENIHPSSLAWKESVASMVLHDTSDIVKKLKHRQKSTFLKPQENMKCVVPDSVVIMGNILHNKN
ncbi:20677_t:CDS:10 [Entrophospora sp. SA101]|nr:20677_t:CDS:10 [Entrophospora sp. SA101]